MGTAQTIASGRGLTTSRVVVGCYHCLRLVTVATALVKQLLGLQISDLSGADAACLTRFALLAFMALDLWHTLHTLFLILAATMAVPALPALELADRTLCSAAFLCPGFCTAQAALSNWNLQAESWTCFYAMSMFVPGCAASFPPAFTVLLWCFVTPCVMLNDYMTHCHSLLRLTEACPADPQQRCTPASLATYLCGPGMVTLAAGTAAGALQITLQVLSTRRAACSTPPSPRQPDISSPAAHCSASGASPFCRTSTSQTDDTEPEEAHLPPLPLPFQTLPHLPFLAPLGRCSALTYLQQWMFSLARSATVDADMLLALLCLPVALYYSALANFIRLGLTPGGIKAPVELSPNEVFLIVLSCVVLGSTSHHLQTSGVLQQVQEQLDRCVECLADVFPLHVAQRLLDGSQPPPGLVMQAACCCCSGSGAGVGGASEPEELRSSRSHSHSYSPGWSQKLEFVPAAPAGGCLPSSGSGSDAAPLPPLRYRSSVDGELMRVRSLPPAATTDAWQFRKSEWRRGGGNSMDVPATATATTAAAATAAAFFARPAEPAAPAAAGRGSVPGTGGACAAAGLRPLSSALSLTSALRLRPSAEATLCQDVAQGHESVTIFFSDICCFSTWAHHLPPDKVMHTLNDLFTRLDNIILNEMPSLYKIETIGDAYVVAANLLTHDPEHAATAVRFAIRAQEEAAKVLRPDRDDGSTIKMRIGLHSGSVMSGVVGRLRRRFCVFGDVVNMGARTEASCPPGGIQLTASTHDLARPYLEGRVALVERGEIRVKGADLPLKMYLVSQEPATPATATAADVA